MVAFRSGCIFAYLNLTIILHGKVVVFRIQDIALVSRITAVCILKNAVVALRKPCNCNFTAWVRCQIVGVAIAIVCSNVCPIGAILFLQLELNTRQRDLRTTAGIALFLNRDLTVGGAVFRVNVDIINPVR